ncbi:MAG: hypothetical protein ACFFD1_03855 [Candidatus Thorarchaeota archaeon]
MKKINFGILITLLFVMIFSSVFLNLSPVKAQKDRAFLKQYTQFSYFQSIENNGEIFNTSELEISLPSPSWNLTHFEANFTDIFLNQELISIEDNPTDFYTIQKFQPLLAVQINISEPTIIYSVDIYADVIEPSVNPIYIQINGFDIPTQKPNNTIIYNPIELNISSDTGWHRQSFSNPSTLAPGYYSLVIDGSGIGNAPQPLYRWFTNNENATNPDLMIWRHNGISWSTGVKNQTFLHKFIQKTPEVINPEDLDMQLELNGDSYAISNGFSPGTGNVTIKDINFSSLDTILNIPITTNKTIELIFNCSYYIKLNNHLTSFGSVTIDFDNLNFWNATFIVNKILLNNSITFNYPSNWQNITVYQSNVNISSLVNFNDLEHSISLTDDILIDNAKIVIIANSLNYDFNLDIRSTDFNPDQELMFSIYNPETGNYTFVLYNSLGYPLDDSIQTIHHPIDNNLFSYHIPANAKEGEYHAYVYFFDGFNAGLEVASFNIRIPFIITFFIILISSAAGITAIASSYVVIKKYKKKKEARKNAIRDKFNDILSLNHVMISERKTSLNVYEQTFIAKKIDTGLVSGFLSAIRSFGIELTNTEDTTQTIKLEYKDSKILMSEFKDFRIVLIMSDIPSSSFFESLKRLSYDIEVKYGKLLESFRGNIQPFASIEELLKIHLNTSFLYPLKIVKIGKVKVSQLEKNLIIRARNQMKKRNSNYFYISYLIEDKSWDPKDIEVLFSILEKKIFQPVI